MGEAAFGEPRPANRARTARRRGAGHRRAIFLGFTRYWGRSRKGKWIVVRKAAAKRFTRTLRAIGQWCRTHRHLPVAAQEAALQQKLLGHYGYYGITGNSRSPASMRHEVRRVWHKWPARCGPAPGRVRRSANTEPWTPQHATGPTSSTPGASTVILRACLHSAVSASASRQAARRRESAGTR